jgi:hypothetical protein
MSAVSGLASAKHHHAVSRPQKSPLAASVGAKAPAAVSAGTAKSPISGGLAKLQQAVTDALKSVQPDGTTDPNQAIQSALTKIFQADPTAPDNDQDSSTSTDAATAGKSFQDVLKSFGVSASQFQSDIKAAIQKAGTSGKVDVAALFKSFPTGSTLDAVG